MNGIIKKSVLGVSAGVMGIASVGFAPSASAQDYIAIEIVPICSSAEYATSFWKVTNKNDYNVDFTWNNFENDAMGDFSAISGESQLNTYFEASDPNNTTRFTNPGVHDTQTNAQVAECGDNSGVVFPTTPEEETPGEETPVVTPPVEGGMGGGSEEVAPTTPVTVGTAPAAATLANTGASTTAAYSAAAIIALFTAGATLAVRRNLI